MNITIHSLHFDADKKLIDYIENKVGKLSQVSDDILGADVTLKLENNGERDNKIAEIKIDIPRVNDLFAKKQTKTFEESIDTATQALRRQILKSKKKQRGL
ncbi:MAG TPA: ribosome-associated translation inhibitor RaiA [Bacteroidales bacterium]|jgi:putative sigma-54 modulation protein|nr:ribosome-associated translation inhibitor RaiA [Bacteroidales bacterium]MDD4235068.1 ribosome-associated translation inhibitor RaiA [Bacteroidales bacterium]MDY0160545.1 ribosome-associated translation inhibitor RaiA [Bacteroidales bacterium]HXK81209.1 ribosome-associated translation inhibitor RaiA [Bacteroidales bacterium]